MPSRLKIRLATRDELSKYESYMDKFHYLGAVNGSLSKCLRYIVEDSNGEWASLLDFGYAALKNAARDTFIGWDAQQKTKRLKYVLNNTRFLVLPWMKSKYHCLASQSLSLAVKTISSDWQHYHGHHILLLETFVDEQREGTCYRAANWQHVGETKGFGKKNGSYVEHGNKKKVFVYPLYKKSQLILSEKYFPHPLLATETKAMIDLNALDLSGLEAVLSTIPDPRIKKVYPIGRLLTLTVCAFLSGYDSYVGVGQYAENLTHDARRKLGFRVWSMPDESSIRRLINRLDQKIFFEIVRDWLIKKSSHSLGLGCKAIAIDGKAMRACKKEGEPTSAPIMLSALVHNTGVTIGQREVAEKSNEIPALIELLRSINIKRAVITADAMHTQKNTADFILKKGGNYIFPVKDNQQTLGQDIDRLHPQESFSPTAYVSRQRARQN